MSIKKLLNVATISSEFRESIAIFPGENQKCICASGSFCLIQGHALSNSLADTDAFFLTQISTRDTHKVIEVKLPIQQTIIKSKNWPELYSWMLFLTLMLLFVINNKWFPTKVNSSHYTESFVTFMEANIYQTYTFNMGIYVHFIGAHLTRAYTFQTHAQIRLPFHLRVAIKYLKVTHISNGHSAGSLDHGR